MRCVQEMRERVQRWSSLRTWKLSSLFSCWNFHRDQAQIWTVCVPILHTVINYGLQLLWHSLSLFLCIHPFSFPRLTLSLAGDCILHMFCSTNADIYQFCTKCNGDCNFHINGILPFIIKRGAFYIVVYKTRWTTVLFLVHSIQRWTHASYERYWYRRLHTHKKQQLGHKIIDICNVTINLKRWKSEQKCDGRCAFSLWWLSWAWWSQRMNAARIFALFVHCMFFFLSTHFPR